MRIPATDRLLIPGDGRLPVRAISTRSRRSVDAPPESGFWRRSSRRPDCESEQSTKRLRRAGAAGITFRGSRFRALGAHSAGRNGNSCSEPARGHHGNAGVRAGEYRASTGFRDGNTPGPYAGGMKAYRTGIQGTALAKELLCAIGPGAGSGPRWRGTWARGFPPKQSRPPSGAERRTPRAEHCRPRRALRQRS
jgi:hypothetical protein